MRKGIDIIIEGQYSYDGAGVRLRRIFGGQNIARLTDPFLLLDNFGSKDPKDYEKGFPWHPHRGIETVTYILDGKVKHRDSTGVSGTIGKGELQWMTAGSGIFHEEMPQVEKEGNSGLQLWVNLPKEAKMRNPVYRNLKDKNMPSVEDGYGNRIKVIAGRRADAVGPISDLSIPIGYFVVDMKRNSVFSQKLEEGHTAIAYVLEGRINVEKGAEVKEGSAAIYKRDGDEVAISTDNENAKVMLISGRPLNEPIAWYGPIVMNYKQELVKAYEELQNGDFIKEQGSVEDL
ncbi:MAG: pirin family protein [Candidatus Marsarchaeota archaeon]|nr:pirin family protein [Candidatus Marsarchaeota archaeon]